VSSYAGDAHPSVLFEGVRLRLSIVICSHGRGQQSTKFLSTIFQRWYAAERGLLFHRMTLWPGNVVLLWDVFTRLGGHAFPGAWAKIIGDKTRGCLTDHLGSGDSVFYQEAAQYFVKASRRIPFFAKNGSIGAPPHGRFINCTDSQAPILAALLSSSLFYQWYHAVSDCYHVSDAIVQALPCPPSIMLDTELASLGQQLEDFLHREAKVVEIQTNTGDTIAYAAFNCQDSKPILDKIDAVLARHYGFTEKELDFIISYDIKYRMGRDLTDDNSSREI
jgi:hypothetical protein